MFCYRRGLCVGNTGNTIFVIVIWCLVRTISVIVGKTIFVIVFQCRVPSTRPK